MNYDIIVAGVGGQGVISVGAIIAESAVRSGLIATQSEVHGMSQRGGAVISHLRLSDRTIESGTIGQGRADLLIALEPLESLRHLKFLSRSAQIIVSADPVENIERYPAINGVLDSIRRLPSAVIVDASRLAREAGSARTANVIMVGAAASSLPIDQSTIRQVIREWFEPKGEKMVRINLDAFEMGQEAVRCVAA